VLEIVALPAFDVAPEQFQFQPALLGGDKFGLSARKGACGSVKGGAVTGKEGRVAHDRLGAPSTARLMSSISPSDEVGAASKHVKP
jgi:hypothetical protein